MEVNVCHAIQNAQHVRVPQRIVQHAREGSLSLDQLVVALREPSSTATNALIATRNARPAQVRRRHAQLVLQHSH